MICQDAWQCAEVGEEEWRCVNVEVNNTGLKTFKKKISISKCLSECTDSHNALLIFKTIAAVSNWSFSFVSFFCYLQFHTFCKYYNTHESPFLP